MDQLTAIEPAQAERHENSDWIIVHDDHSYSRMRRYWFEYALTDHGPDFDGVLQQQRSQCEVPSTMRTSYLMDLAPELRNRIYEYAIPTQDLQANALIISTPYLDDSMARAQQLAITKASRQLRNETLAMFYAKSTFVAYIEDFDFSPLITWVEHVTSTTVELPNMTVHVKLLDRFKCELQVLRLVRGWMDVNHQKIHLKIHNLLSPREGRPPPGAYRFDQRQLVADAIDMAERQKKEGPVEDRMLRMACYEILRKFGAGSVGCVWKDVCRASSTTEHVGLLYR